MKRYIPHTVAVLIVVFVVLAALMGCGREEPKNKDPIEHGVVVARKYKYVTVREADGELDKHHISKYSMACQVGEAYPDCLK